MVKMAYEINDDQYNPAFLEIHKAEEAGTVSFSREVTPGYTKGYTNFTI